MDPLRTLFADLHSPDPAIRFSVLSRIEDLEWNEQQIATLRALAAQERDPGTRFHMQKILARIEQERGRQQAPAATASQIEGLLKNEHRDDLSLALLLESLPRAEAPLVAMALRETDWTNFDAPLLPFILRFLKQYGSPEDVPQIETLCRHPDPRVLAAAVEALEKLNPERLKDLIVPLLVNPVHGIRSRAVRLLYRWDPQEALLHFEAMLFSEDPEDRQAALFHAFFFPFAEIEPLLLKFLGIENDPAMLERAGLLFRANPTSDEPLRLLEAREASLGEKKRVIGEILTGVVDSLYQAGLVAKRPAELLAELEGQFFQRRTVQLIDSCQLSLRSADPQERREAAMRLAELFQRGFKETRSILEAWLPTEPDPALREAVLTRLGPAFGPPARPGSPVAPSSPEAPAAGAAAETAIQEAPSEIDLSLAPPAQRLRILANLNRGGLRRVRSCLPALLRTGTSEEKVLLLQALGRCGDKGDAAIALGGLNDADPRIIVTAIEVLRDLDPDLLSPHLPRLIQHATDEVRAAAVRVFALFDKRQALSLVEKMLFSLQPKQRSLAIFSAAQLDFPSVRDLLLRALEKEQIAENARQICSILRAHLDEELFFVLQAAVKSAPEATREVLQAFAHEAAATLIRERRTRWSRPEELVAEAERRTAAATQRQQQAQPSYALKNIQKIRQQQMAAETPRIDPGLVQFAVVAFSTGAVLTALIWFLFLAPAPPPTTTSGEVAAARPASPPFDRTARNIEGQITEANQQSQTIRVVVPGDPPETFLIEFRDSGLSMPPAGSRFRGQIRPRGREGDVIRCEVLAVY